MEPKFSVIVPVYNVEEYLHYCVNSILKQNYKKYEIILVNDGSQDTCPRICDEYAEQDKRIKVIHKENGGLSDARNAGISEASGDYLLFVDSDDLIEQNSLSEIARTIENNNFPDVVFLEATKFYPNGKTEPMGDGYIHEIINKKYPGDYEKRKQLRLEKEKPVLEAFWSWLAQQKPVRNSRMEKAVNYVQNRRNTAETYLEDGRCSFTNNLSENAIRPFAVGRKNWLFSSSVDGANASAIVYTMVEMAKAHDLNIYGYLKFLLEHRPDKDMTDEQLADLAPWSEKLQSIKNRM